MKKSLYSLMLFDEIIDRIDEIAYLKNTNRSQLINDLLAESIGMVTPEQKMNQIIEIISDNLSDRLNIESKKNNNSISFVKSLKFKYRPKINYTIEFNGRDNGKHAVLKVSSRSTSESLNDHLDRIFNFIKSKEKDEEEQALIHGENYGNYVFVRHFPVSCVITKDVREISDALTKYIIMLDDAMNDYFKEPKNTGFESIFNQVFRQF